jgi:hypothetical protein
MDPGFRRDGGEGVCQFSFPVWILAQPRSETRDRFRRGGGRATPGFRRSSTTYSRLRSGWVKTGGDRRDASGQRRTALPRSQACEKMLGLLVSSRIVRRAGGQGTVVVSDKQGRSLLQGVVGAADREKAADLGVTPGSTGVTIRLGGATPAAAVRGGGIDAVGAALPGAASGVIGTWKL